LKFECRRGDVKKRLIGLIGIGGEDGMVDTAVLLLGVPTGIIAVRSILGRWQIDLEITVVGLGGFQTSASFKSISRRMDRN